MGDRTHVERGIVAAFFLTLAIVGVLVYDEFGMSWDEPGLVHYGDLLLQHYGPGGDWETYLNLRFYGPVGPVLLAFTDRLTDGAAFPAGHLTNFACFLAGVAAFYALCRFQFGSRLWALLGAALLVLSPRLFLHGFVNPKDMPLMSVFIVAVYLLARYMEGRERRWILLCGVATAVALGIRVTGAFVIVLVLLALAADELARRDRAHAGRTLVSVGWYLLVSVALTVLMWPFLWGNPAARFYEAATVMSNFIEGPKTVLHLGEVISVTELPWHYLPVWIGVTTPPLFVALMFAGLFSVRRALSALRTRGRERLLLLYLVWGLAPIAAIAVARPPLYDEWRQALFVYPALLLLAVEGARRIAGAVERSRFRRPLATACAVVLGASLVWSLGDVVRLHPYQVAYFNFLAGDAPHEQFDVDYWGISYREGLERLLNAEPGPVDLYVCSGPGRDSAVMIEPARAARIRYVDAIDQAQYTLCAPRASLGGWAPGGQLLFTIERDGIPLLVAHRRF